MIKYIFILLLLTVSTELYSQDRKLFRIQPGQKVVEAIPKEDLYVYPEFQTGQVYFKNNTYAEAKMNYQVLFGEMQFIDPEGDTLSLDNESTIRMITVNGDTFFYDRTYLQLAKDFGKIRLASKELISFVNRQKLGGMGETTSASVDTYTSLNSGNYFRELVAKEIITLSRHRIYFIGDRFNHYSQVTRKSLMNAFPGKEKEVKDYIRDHKTDLTSADELEKLIIHFQDKE